MWTCGACAASWRPRATISSTRRAFRRTSSGPTDAAAPAGERCRRGAWQTGHGRRDSAPYLPPFPCLIQALLVGTTRIVQVGGLNRIILPATNSASFIGAFLV